MKQPSNQQIALRVSGVTIVWNTILSLFKLAAGVLGHSSAMVSDAIHSASDVFSTIIVMIGVKLAGKAPDKEHPYGHERMECVAAILLSAILLATGIGIGYAGVQKVFGSDATALLIPSGLALVAAVVSILAKEGMYWYTRAAARKIHSGALMADAWHHRSDALSSIGSLVGILGARLGYPILDPLASLVICIFIGKAAISIFIDAINKMTDRACDDDMAQLITEKISRQQGVIAIDQINTRLFGDKIYVDVEISADGNLSLEEAHETAQRVHDTVEANFPEVKHCMVHVNPAVKELSVS